MGRETRTQMVKASGRTYFFDLKVSKKGEKYLTLTESRWDKDGQRSLRARIILFPEQAKEFSQAVAKMAAQLV
jgi:hypothetical protein